MLALMLKAATINSVISPLLIIRICGGIVSLVDMFDPLEHFHASDQLHGVIHFYVKRLIKDSLLVFCFT